MAYFLLVFLLFAILPAAADDAAALLAFKASSIALDPRSALRSWTVGGPVCSWAGVTCGPAGSVTALSLRDMGLSGRLSLADLLALPLLTAVDLSGNAFSGALPFPSARPCPFQTLDLSRNDFSEAVPGGFLAACAGLLSLNLSGNNIPGGIYPFPPSLQTLDLSSNNISDVSLLRHVLANCRSLRHLNFSRNILAAGLAPPAPACASLSVFDLSHNPFSTLLPAGFVAAMSPAKTHIALAGCNLTGDFSAQDFGDCGNLTYADFSGNLLAGGPPASISECVNLDWLDLSGNHFTANIPSYLSTLRRIRRLSLANNNLSGKIPVELAQLCPSLVELDLSANALTGGLPPPFAGCTGLQVLDLSRNALSGDFVSTVIPVLPAVRRLLLGFNNITGPAPLTALKNCTRLEAIDMSANGLTGEIPTGICAALPALQWLTLPDNYLTGALPASWEDCGVLEVLDLSFNMLVGRIPVGLLALPRLRKLALWANELAGEIADVLCSKGTAMEVLVLNHNQLTGKIPPSISRCSSLMWVNLGGNHLGGEIPSAIGGMENLAVMQLGDNELTGSLPESLGRCPKLIWLDVYMNMLTGPIPATLSAQTGKVTPARLLGTEFAFLRNEAGTSCPASGTLFEFSGIREARLASYKRVHMCPWTRIYVGQMMVYTFKSNGSMLYLDLSHNSLSGSVPETLGIMMYLLVLNFGHNHLTGTIPRSFGGLKSVGVIDLSFNSISGPIPGELATLPFLNDLDLSNNNLSGPIPRGGQLATFPASRFANNTFLCGDPLPPCSGVSSSSSAASSPASRSFKRRLLGTMFIGILVCVIAAIGLFFLLGKVRRSRKTTEKHLSFVQSLSRNREDPWSLPNAADSMNVTVMPFRPLKKLTFGNLVEATNGFSSESLIGSGGFGEVFRAKLKDGCEVAVKKLLHMANQGDREFMAEMETIGKIKHKNLVPLLGYCKVGDERLLVYEFMKYGSLHDVLHERGKDIGGDRINLDWPTRKKIATGAARGLAYLHHSCIPRIIHRDMKSSNVLVDESLDARVSDFGMARLVNALDTHLSVSALSGTPGYVPPEYYQSFRCTTKGDIYSFGVVLLELLSGRPPLNMAEFGDSNLVGWGKQLAQEGRARDVFDPELAADEVELEQWLKLTLSCLEDRPNRRPTMAQVIVRLKELQPELDVGGLDSEGSLVNMELDEDAMESV